jgi:hypothetical protein
MIESLCSLALKITYILLIRRVTRYFARQLLNKHAKNYQNVEKITKFPPSTKVVWKSIKHLSKTKWVKHFPSLKLSFFIAFLSHLYFLIAIVQNANMVPRWSARAPGVPSPQSAQGEWWSAGFLRIPSIQLDSLGQQLAFWMYSFAGMEL